MHNKDIHEQKMVNNSYLPVQAFENHTAVMLIIDPSTGSILEANPATVPVMGNATRIHEIIMNLCINASHAMNEKGLLEVKHEEVTFQNDFLVTVGTGKPGMYSVIEVKDRGCGIAADVLPRIFEPYFTTRPVGKGTGLGLSVVAGVVQDCGGAIIVESEPGRGASFKVLLPKTYGAIVGNDRTETPIQRGTERILFIDDENFLCDIAVNILGNLGYKVTAFADSLKALNHFKQSPDDFDLIITDQTMPVITGTELAKELLMAGIRGYCLKPIRKTDIALKIREMLDLASKDITDSIDMGVPS